jgi:hypothetical protein
MINSRLFPGNNPTTQEGFRRWLQEVAKQATNEDADPVILPKKNKNGSYVNEDGTPYTEFDYMGAVPGFDTLSAIGDQRYSLGHMMSAAFEKYLPKIQLYTEIAQAGGCQVINDYICDSEGIPIQRVSSNCPDGDLNIDPNEVVEFVLKRFEAKKQEDVDGFVQFVKENYIKYGYNAELNTLKDFPYVFFVKLKKGNDTKYLRYYYDDRFLVAKGLGLQIIEVVFNLTSSDISMTNALRDPVPIYNRNIAV